MIFSDNKQKLGTMFLLGINGQHSIQASAMNVKYK